MLLGFFLSFCVKFYLFGLTWICGWFLVWFGRVLFCIEFYFFLCILFSFCRLFLLLIVIVCDLINIDYVSLI
jgi:hypothetical protein